VGSLDMHGGQYRMRVSLPQGNCTLRMWAEDNDGAVLVKEQTRHVRVVDEQVILWVVVFCVRENVCFVG
jgi:hypothetical protein